MVSTAKTVDDYLAELLPDRRDALLAVREAVNQGLPSGYQEGMQYGMIGWYVPHSVYPPGYHCDPAQPLPFAGLASQKNHMSLYLFCIYGSEGRTRWFVEQMKAKAKKVDMGKACIRFKKLEALDLDVVREAVRIPVDEFIAEYEAAIGPRRKAGAK